MHQVTYKKISIKLSSDFSEDTLQARIEWNNIFNALKVKKKKKKILLAKISKTNKAILQKWRRNEDFHRSPLLHVLHSRKP